MADSLKQRTITGTLWSGIHKFATVFLAFISGIILARLLSPHDYGVIGMLAIFLAVSQTFIDGGFGSALIQKQSPTDVDYSTILYWNIGFSVFLYFVLYASAPLIAHFYELPLLIDVLRVQGVILIINAARIVQRNQLRKQLNYKKIAIINIVSNVGSLLITIILAAKGYGVWALVVQQLSLSLLATLLYWVTSKWKPVFVFSKKSFKELFNFGIYVLLANLFNTLCNNIQGLLIGKVYNSSMLGYYTKAQRTESLASQFVSSVLEQVSYPVLSEVQSQNQRMISILKKFIGSSAFVTFPLMLLLILVAKPLFLILYSERWLPCVPYFQILCFSGIAVSLQGINYYGVAAVGKSKALFEWTVYKRLIGLVFVIGGLWLWNIEGLLWGWVLSTWTIYIINASLVSKYIGYTVSRQLKDLLPIILIALFSFMVSYVTLLFGIDDIYVNGLIRFFVFSITFFLISKILNIDALTSTKEIADVVLTRIHNKRN